MDVLSEAEATPWKKTSLMDSSNTANISEKDTNLQEEEGNEQQHPKERRFCSVRYGLAVIIHGTNLLTASQSFSLSIAIIAMVNNTGQSNQSNLYAATNAQVPVYDWSPEAQGILLSSSIYGTLISIIPGGYLAGVFSGKKIAGFSFLISSVLSLLTPLAADHGLPYLILTRIVQGLVQGMTISPLQSFWRKWAPPLERTQLSVIAYSGITSGNFIILFVGGFLCQSLGWPSIFYICGKWLHLNSNHFYFSGYKLLDICAPYDTQFNRISESRPPQRAPLTWKAGGCRTPPGLSQTRPSETPETPPPPHLSAFPTEL
ncbi:probable small intestine urate exporter [Gracilinanus agilis]|uniref:probable small intestine urate exporter n=1 Tax=Gracilinanus agilis TaxID=191870 RepID=UPI001CFECDFB|nr:probable small intestine urate exporter [Gracilinanus agilis]